jgi:Protein of unknown function (DUF2950)/Protein of unknown function (DUF3300)
MEAEPWDPSVKSLVPFPVVLATMNNNLSWLQQLGYAFATQQADVFASVQRLRHQAQANGRLESSPQQVVSVQQVMTEPPPGSGQAPTQQEAIAIQPAQPDVVYVPTDQPSTVYGSWPYPSYPPYYAAPPTGYYFGTALATGLAFAAGTAVVGGLWGWARPAWGGGYAYVNQFNSINANRQAATSSRWGAGNAGGRPANSSGPPGGPVGLSRPFARIRPKQCRAAPDRRWGRGWPSGEFVVRVVWAAQVDQAGQAASGVLVVRVGWEVQAGLAASGALVVRVVRAALGAHVSSVAPAGRPRGRVEEASASQVGNVGAAHLVISTADARLGSSHSAAHRADPSVSSDRSRAGGAAAVAGRAVAVDVAGGVRRSSMEMPKTWPWVIVVSILCVGAAQATPASTPEPQRSFASVEDAASAFVAALRDHREAELRAILGPDADRVVTSGDRYADRELQQRFVALYDEKHTIDQMSPGHAELVVGPNDWPLPIPLVESNGRWIFDTKAGAQTIIDRRVGNNELSAIRTLLTCVDAQNDYFNRAKQANGTGAYATRLVSTPGRHDGLYWPVGPGETESPLAPLIDAVQNAGYPGELVGGKPIPFEGYYFRILKAQGPNGDGGAKSYIHSGLMTGGFALIAWPAVFGSSGIMTFIAGPDGDVYQKDFGPETAHIAAAMTTFDPDLAWSRVEATND